VGHSDIAFPSHGNLTMDDDIVLPKLPSRNYMIIW
jgi:hypothetical protein